MNMLMTLQARQTASLAPEAAVRVRCLRGMLWIVGQRDGQDCVLEAGQTALLGAQRHYLSSVHSAHAVSFELRQFAVSELAAAAKPGAGPNGGPEPAFPAAGLSGGAAWLVRWRQRLRQFC